MANLYVNSIIYNRSLVDGPGVRTVLFLQGCDLHCEGCQNKSAWDITKGEIYDVKHLAELLKQNSINKKLTISGGEPLMQLDGVIELVDMLDGFDICLYTGHDLEQVPQVLLDKLYYIKVGRYEQDKKTTIMPYVGSINQKFIQLR